MKQVPNINKCAMQSDILFLQEHCLYQSEFCDMSKLGGGMGVKATSAMDENVFIKEGACMVDAPSSGTLLLETDCHCHCHY